MSEYIKTRIVKEGTEVDNSVYNMIDTKQPMIGNNGFYKIQGTMNVPSGEATLYRVTDDMNRVFLAKHYRMAIKPETRKKMLDFLMHLQKDSCVMPILDCGEYFNTPFDILPYYEDKDLSQKGPMDVNFIKNIFLPSMNSALNEVHEAGIVHRDIKPENLFYVVSEQKVILGDFGIASNLSVGSNFKSTEIGRGTVGYLAPEIKNNNVHVKTDYYALGVTVVCLMAGGYIFKDMDEVKIYQMITNNSFSECIKDRRLRQLVRGLTLGDINMRFDGKEIVSYINNKVFRVVGDVDKSREVQIDRPYQFENQTHYDVESLGKAMADNWPQAVEHLKRGLIERHFVDINPDLYIYIQKVLEEEEDIDYAMTRVLYRFNSEIGICYKGNKYESFQEISKDMMDKYPVIDQDYRKFLDNEVLLNLAREKYRTSKSLDDEMLVKFLGSIQDIGNRDLAYFYFLLFQQGVDNMPKFYADDLEYFGIQDLCKNLLISPNPTGITRKIAQNNCALAYLACYAGLPEVVKIHSNFESRPFFETHLAILSLLEKLTEVNFNRIAYMGFGKWLLDNYSSYSYKGKKANTILKNIFESRNKFKNASTYKLSDYAKLIDEMEENVKAFVSSFNYNLIMGTSKDGIFAKGNEYYLALEFEGEICCLAYKQTKTTVDMPKDSQMILNNEIDKCIGLTNRNLMSVNNIFERNNVLKRKREEEAIMIKTSNFKWLCYFLIACLINAFCILLYLDKINLYVFDQFNEYINYGVYGFGILFDLYFLIATLNFMHNKLFLNAEAKQYKILESCRVDINKTMKYFQNKQSDIKIVSAFFLKNKKMFNPKFTRIDYKNTFDKCETSLSKHQNLRLPSVKFNHFIIKSLYFLALGTGLLYIALYCLTLTTLIAPSFIIFITAFGVSWLITYLVTGLRIYKKKQRFSIFRYIIGLIISVLLFGGLVFLLSLFMK